MCVLARLELLFNPPIILLLTAEPVSILFDPPPIKVQAFELELNEPPPITESVLPAIKLYLPAPIKLRLVVTLLFSPETTTELTAVVASVFRLPLTTVGLVCDALEMLVPV